MSRSVSTKAPPRLPSSCPSGAAKPWKAFMVTTSRARPLLVETGEDLDDILVAGLGVDLVGHHLGLEDGVADGVGPVQGSEEQLVAGGQPLAQRALDGQALVAAAHPLEQHLGGDQQ